MSEQTTTNIEDGGPAFPSALQNGLTNDSYTDAGMTLRDYFAAKAMQGDFAAQTPDAWERTDELTDAALLVRARVYYRVSEAMIAARKEVRP